MTCLLTHLHDDGVLTLSLNRPDKLNAITNDLARALLAALADAAQNPQVRVLRLRGEGRAFCAGRDLSEPPTEDDLVLVQAVSQALVRLPQPVVAEVQGWAVGAGLEWMLNADLVVASREARFKLPEAELGVFVTGGLSATLPASVGLMRAKGLVWLGQPFDAQQAQTWGLVWQVVDAAALPQTAADLATTLAQRSPQVMAAYKRVFNGIGLSAFDHAVAQENAAQRALQAP